MTRAEEIALIDAAIAAGKLKRYPMGEGVLVDFGTRAMQAKRRKGGASSVSNVQARSLRSRSGTAKRREAIYGPSKAITVNVDIGFGAENN